MMSTSILSKPKASILTLLPCLLLLATPDAYAEPAPVSKDDLTPVSLMEDPVQPGPAPPEPGPIAVANPPPSAASPAVIPVITTSRPSFTDAYTTVPQGSLQAESGATYTDESSRARSWTLPETLLRLGVTRNTEFRFSVPNATQVWDEETGRRIGNFGDLSVGLSHHRLLPGRVNLAIIPLLSVPSGANSLSSNSVNPQLRIAAGKAVTSRLTLSGQLGTQWNTAQNASAAVVLNPTVISYYYLHKKLCWFLEYAGFYPTAGRTIQILQSGLLYTPTPRQQWDARIARGLNGSSPDILVGFGYSFRIDGLIGTSRDFSSFRH